MNPEPDPWDELIELLRLLCAFIPCPPEYYAAKGQEGAERIASGAIDIYEQVGVKVDGGPEVIPGYLESLGDIVGWLNNHPGWLNASLEAELRKTLADMADDLVNQLP